MPRKKLAPQQPELCPKIYQGCLQRRHRSRAPLAVPSSLTRHLPNRFGCSHRSVDGPWPRLASGLSSLSPVTAWHRSTRVCLGTLGQSAALALGLGSRLVRLAVGGGRRQLPARGQGGGQEVDCSPAARPASCDSLWNDEPSLIFILQYSVAKQTAVLQLDA